MSENTKQTVSEIVKAAADDKEAKAFLEGIKYGFKYAPKPEKEKKKD